MKLVRQREHRSYDDDGDGDSHNDDENDVDKDHDEHNASPKQQSYAAVQASVTHLSRHAASAAEASDYQVGCLAPDQPELGRGALCFLPDLQVGITPFLPFIFSKHPCLLMQCCTAPVTCRDQGVRTHQLEA